MTGFTFLQVCVHTTSAENDNNLLFGLLSDMFRIWSFTSKNAPEFLRLQYRFAYSLLLFICSSDFAQLVCDCPVSECLPYARRIILKGRIVQHFCIYALLVENGFITQADAGALLQELIQVFLTAAKVTLVCPGDDCVVMMEHAILMSQELPYK